MSLIKTGSRIGNWQVAERLGEGAMGIVYAADHTLFRTRRALKVIKPEWSRNNDQVVRFLREALAAGSVSDPNIISVFDAGFAEEQRGGTTLREAYYLMECLSGGATLADWSLGKAIGWQTVTAIADQMCSGLSAAHRAGIMHRDLKPANIYVNDDGNSLRLKIFDFGLAKLVNPLFEQRIQDATAEMPFKGTVGFIGTPVYVAPEQARGDATTSYLADVYSVGAVLYELLTGDAPIKFGRRLDREMTRELFMKEVVPIIESQRPKKVRDLASSCPDWLATVVEQCLAKDPRDRPESMDELRRYLLAGRMRPPSGASDTVLVDMTHDAQFLGFTSSFMATNRVEKRPLKPKDIPTVVGDQKLPGELVIETLDPRLVATVPPTIAPAATVATQIPTAKGSMPSEPTATAPPRPTPEASRRDLDRSTVRPRPVLMIVGGALVTLVLCGITALFVYLMVKEPRSQTPPPPSSEMVKLPRQPPAPEPPVVKPIEPCPSGQERVETVCCWKGQRLERGACAGRPTSCPTGLSTIASECSSDRAAIRKDRYIGKWALNDASFTIDFVRGKPTVSVSIGKWTRSADATWNDTREYIDIRWTPPKGGELTEVLMLTDRSPPELRGTFSTGETQTFKRAE